LTDLQRKRREQSEAAVVVGDDLRADVSFSPASTQIQVGFFLQDPLGRGRCREFRVNFFVL